MSEPLRVLLTGFALASFGSILLSLIVLTLRPGLLRKGRLGSILSAFVERIGDIEVERPEPPPDPRGRLLSFQPPVARPHPEEEEVEEVRVPEA